MNIDELLKKTAKPKLYEKGTAFMWTDPHISKQLLQVHLDPDNDLASRRQSTIEKTVSWILDGLNADKELNILDLGCGPGLYAEQFAKSGHVVTGIDISESSIDHAIASARESGLNIRYQIGSYLDIDLGTEQYDLIVLIYTDIGVLISTERKKLLGRIYTALKPNGTFIFDVLKDEHLKEKLTAKTWDTSEGGFWRAMPHLVLSESFSYEKEKVMLYQHTVVDNTGRIDNYRFWTHYFSQDDISRILKHHNFRNLEFQADLLPESDMWNGDNVLFVKCDK